MASATKDRWADPHGAFIALRAATPIYSIFGYVQDFPDNIPDPDRPCHGITGCYLRSGVHDLTEYDWMIYLDWCDRWLPG